jgi:outer membrane protein insertion porin family
LRLGAFFDFGNVWVTANSRGLVAPEGFDLGDLRYSAGLSAVWLSPVGALSASVAYPFNDKEDDDTQTFQFGFGTTF